MVIDFSKIDMRKRPNFILRNLDGTAIGYLGHILEPSARICYTEVSELEFKYLSADNGEKLDEYDLLTSMRVIDVEGYGQFLLQSPVENNDTVVKMKTCKAYSLEYELTGKKITIEEGTYNFWNPLAPDGTIMGIILSELPSWSIGTISSDLIGKYRTYSADNQSVYDFMKSKLQESYDCIFDFDTYNRTIHVRSFSDEFSTKAIYLSARNLLDEIEIEENTNELVTVLDVHGADDLDIRSVNPMGTNKIYNLDAYMNESYFSAKMIMQWGKWKQTFDSYQQTYFDLSVEQTMLFSQLATENAVLADLKGELSGLESKKATLVQAAAMDSSKQSDLSAVNEEISAKESEINRQENTIIASIENKITALTNQLKNINQLTAFSSFFSEEEITILDRYFKCGSLTDSTFVATNADSYSTDGTTVRGLSSIFNLLNLNELQKTEYTSDKTFYSVRGGTIETNNADFVLEAEIVRGTLEVNSDFTFVLSLYLNDGTLNNDTAFSGATVSMTGTLIADVTTADSLLQFKTAAANVYFTRDVTEYQKQSIAMELYDYAEQFLAKASQPTYYFSVDSGNFFALDEFVEFARQFSLGEKLYLHLNDTIYNPYVLAVSIDFDDLSDFSIEFNEYFQAKEGVMDIRQILEQAVSSSHSLDFNQYLYSSFVNSGAKTSVEQFMQSAIDAMKNNIMAGANNELVIDGTGLRCMKYDEISGTYSPKQIWMAHNAIMFTEDNWESATIGIGEFTDKNFGSLYGIVLPALVGTILAGKNLIIESEKQDGGVAVFKMDAEGASLHNASFNLYGETGGRIDMGATFGIVSGNDPDAMFDYDEFNSPIGVKTEKNDSVTKIADLDTNDAPNVNFWLDMDGNSYFKGTILARDGFIGGWTLADDYLYSGSNGNYVALNASENTNSLYAMWAGATNPENAPFWVKKNGDIYAKNGTFAGELSSPTLTGILAADGTNSWLQGCGIRVGANAGATNGYNFYVDTNGNVTMQGNLTLKSGSISWADLGSSVTNEINSAYNLASDAYDLAEDNELPSYIKSTYISSTEVRSPEITGGTITGADINGAEFHNEYGHTTLVLGSNTDGYGDLTFYGGKSGQSRWEVFSIYDGADHISLNLFGNQVLYMGSDDCTYATGEWDFSQADVTGLDSSSTARFG